MPNQYSAAPELSIDTSKSFSATLHTSEGDISIDFYPADAPQTVNNFVFLARDGYFDDVIFHRIVPGFVIQGGDPTGTGSGGPGYRFEDEFHSRTSYDRGIVAMANAGPNTNGSQFFICLDDVGLPNQYTIFGEVTDGMEVVDTIARADLKGEKPVTDIVIRSVTITES
ncbi:MAG: peptidylprolyl isomerase [Acidimicrobiia bacterium]